MDVEESIQKTITHSTEGTQRLGEKFVKGLKDGTLVALNGEIGAGKTVFVRGMAKALNIKENVVSPTFTLMREYTGDKKLYHFDVYRMHDADELKETGFQDYIGGDGITVVEWAEMVEAELPRDRVTVHMKRTDEPDRREIVIRYPKNKDLEAVDG